MENGDQLLSRRPDGRVFSLQASGHPIIPGWWVLCDGRRTSLSLEALPMAFDGPPTPPAADSPIGRILHGPLLARIVDLVPLFARPGWFDLDWPEMGRDVRLGWLPHGDGVVVLGLSEREQEDGPYVLRRPYQTIVGFGRLVPPAGSADERRAWFWSEGRKSLRMPPVRSLPDPLLLPYAVDPRRLERLKADIRCLLSLEPDPPTISLVLQPAGPPALDRTGLAPVLADRLEALVRASGVAGGQIHDIRAKGGRGYLTAPLPWSPLAWLKPAAHPVAPTRRDACSAQEWAACGPADVR